MSDMEATRNEVVQSQEQKSRHWGTIGNVLYLPRYLGAEWVRGTLHVAEKLFNPSANPRRARSGQWRQVF